MIALPVAFGEVVRLRDFVDVDAHHGFAQAAGCIAASIRGSVSASERVRTSTIISPKSAA
jgi:hypothetical protein